MKVVFILVGGLVCGFAASCDATACTIIYFVIRRDVDGTEMSELFLPEPHEEALPEPVSGEATEETDQPQSPEDGPTSQ